MSFYENLIIEGMIQSPVQLISLKCIRLDRLVFLEIDMKISVSDEQEQVKISLNRPDLLPNETYCDIVCGTGYSLASSQTELSVPVLVNTEGIILVIPKGNCGIVVGKKIVSWLKT